METPATKDLWPDMRAIREELGMSQSELALTLGISSRTVQSCEQGWRKTGQALEKSLIMLLIVHRNGPRLHEMKCWEMHQCPEEKCSTCLAFKAKQGYICWFLPGIRCGCRLIRGWENKKLAYRQCPFFKQLLEPKTIPEKAGGA
jgi:DNA-binding XRE family transcriptional regulator